MNRNLMLLATVACMIFLFSVSAANATENADATFDGLVPITVEGLDKTWARQDADLSKYTKIMLEKAEIQYRPTKAAALQYDKPLSQVEYPVSEEGKAFLEQLLVDTFKQELGKSEMFSLVQAAGPDVLKVRISLLDVVSMVPPERSEKSPIFLDSIGEATLVLELYDSQSNAILARATDRGAAESPAWKMTSSTAQTDPEVQELVATWASILRSELEAVKQGIDQE